MMPDHERASKFCTVVLEGGELNPTPLVENIQVLVECYNDVRRQLGGMTMDRDSHGRCLERSMIEHAEATLKLKSAIDLIDKAPLRECDFSCRNDGFDCDACKWNKRKLELLATLSKKENRDG